jgi:hypothetical protein
MTDDPRITELRAWAAWNDRAYEAHDSDEGVAARREANRIADRLGDFSEADWGVIRNAQREEASA